MKILFALTLACTTVVLTARAAADAPGSAHPANPAEAAPDALAALLAAQPDEPQLFPRLRGVRFIAEPGQLAAPGFPADGVDATRVPVLNPGGIRVTLLPFLDAPASEASLQRLVDAVRAYLRFHGRPFAAVYLPPQDVTGGYVQIVATEARSDGEAVVTGAKYFSAASYRAALGQPVGAPIDAARARDGVAWLNRNPYRHADLAAEPGRAPGTTRLALAVQEEFPLTLSASYDNTGTKLTDENRVSAGFTWGNALGRGDLFNYRFAGDPELTHLRSHSGGYTAFLPWRHLLSVQGAWSRLVSELPEPFTQQGTSWQVGARYEIPLAPWRGGVTQTLAFTADFKASDNSLEFATIPVTGNLTHVVQFGGTYGVAFAALGGRNSVALTGYASPGGLSSRNHGRYFAGTRAGAEARYAYGRLNLSHQRTLGAGFSLVLAAEMQAASAALLGSEQLTGSGAGAVRGYRESSAFGDYGAVFNAEVHAPGLALGRGWTADGFGFADAAALGSRGEDDHSDLRSAGAGVNLAWRRYFSLRFSYGWQLKQLDPYRRESGHGHVSANVTW